MKILLSLGFVAVLSGCSSPPQPVDPDFEGSNSTGHAVNSTIPLFVESKGVIPSPATSGNWELIITLRQGQVIPKDQEVPFYYAVTHSTSIQVMSNSLDNYLETKQWLEDLGAKALIVYEHGFVNDTVSIILSKKGEVK